MVTVRRVIEEEIDENEIGAFLAEQAKIVKGRGCEIIPREGEPPFDPVPIRKGDFLHLREDEYAHHGVHAGSPIYVVATVPEAGVFWALYLRSDDAGGIGGMFFNGTQATVPVPAKRIVPRLATGGQNG